MVDLRLLNSSCAFRRVLECHWAGPVRGREACPERGARCATVVHVGPVAHAWLKKATVPGRSSVLRGADCWGLKGGYGCFQWRARAGGRKGKRRNGR